MFSLLRGDALCLLETMHAVFEWRKRRCRELTAAAKELFEKGSAKNALLLLRGDVLFFLGAASLRRDTCKTLYGCFPGFWRDTIETSEDGTMRSHINNGKIDNRNAIAWGNTGHAQLRSRLQALFPKLGSHRNFLNCLWSLDGDSTEEP